MATEVLMPKLGLTMTEGTIEEWKFKEGDTVKKGDIVVPHDHNLMDIHVFMERQILEESRQMR